MVHLLMMSTEPSRQQPQQQQQQNQQQQKQQHQQQHHKLKLKQHQHRKCGNNNAIIIRGGGVDASRGGVETSHKCSLSFVHRRVTSGNSASWSCCRGSGTGVGAVPASVGVGGSGGGICLWFVLVVFMLILCGNTAISQQPQRNIKPPSYNLNNNGNQNHNNNSSGGVYSKRSINILLQISTPSNRNGPAVALSANAGARAEDDVAVAQQVTSDSGQKQQPPNNIKSTATTTNSSTAASTTSSSSSSLPSSWSVRAAKSNNASLNGGGVVDGESGHNNKMRNSGDSSSSGTPANVGVNANTKANINDAVVATSANDNDDNDDDDLDTDDDLDNSSELLNESEDGYEHSSISPTTYRPTQRPSVTPQLTSAQERERRLMHVLAARRSALHRPGFRNRIGTTGRTATAVETTSKSPTDPRSICIRNCTKNFTRRTTASCMRQCANFSRVANQANGGGAAHSGSVVMVKNSSKTGLGTAQAGEKDTNEILFTDESSHGLLVIAKEQNDTVNHINDEVKGTGGLVSKQRGRRKPGATVTAATTSIEDDEIQPYLYFGQKLPPLKPNALTITSVSDDHPKLLEVSVAEETLPSTTPVSVSSTLSAVERSRSHFKYNMRGGVSFNRRYTTLHRGTTPEVPTDVRTTTLRIVTSQPKNPEVENKPEVVAETPIERQEVIPLAVMPREALKEDRIATATPLIITVLSDEEMVSPTSDTLTIANTSENTTASTTTATTSTSTTTERMTTTSTSSTTTTSTTASPPSTTTIDRMTSTTSTPVPRKYPEYAPKRPTTTTTTTTTSTTTTTTTTSTPRTTTTTIIPITSPSTTTTKKSNVIDEDTELLRALGPSLTQPINTDDRTNLIIFVNHTSGVYRGSFKPSSTTTKPSHSFLPNAVTTDEEIVMGSTVLTSIASTANPLTKDTTNTTIPLTTREGESNMPNISTTSQPQVTGEISSTVVTDDQEISLEMHRMNVVTMVLAGIGIVPLLAIILYLLRNYLLKRPIKDDEDFDVCITDQQPISPVKKLDNKYQEEDEDEVDHHKKLPPQRQHSLHSKLVSAPLARDNNHNTQAVVQQRYDDKISITSDQEFERSNIRLKSLLGEGNFGQVWKAEADDLSGHFGATRIVAVKTIKACSTQLSLKDEGSIMRKLGSHQNVVTLLGACVETEPHMLIMEYAMRGRLLSLLRAARNATNILPASVPGGRSLAPLSPRTLAGFCLDIARGMEYIADKRIVHRDLAARNVLLDHNGVCKICDFGMSIDLDAERKRKEQEKNCANEIMRSNFNKFKFDFGGKFIINHWPTGSPQKDGCSEKKSHGHDTIGKRPALPIRWMAPESLQYNVFSMETDLWAFGIVLWEIATLGSTPYSHLTGREVIRRVPQGLRPDLPKEGRHEFYNLMSRCWHKDPQMRPSFSQCRLEISRSLHKWVDDDSAASDYMDVSGFSEDLEQGMVYFNHRISEFECEI